jgi:hypothetical protein
MTTEATTETKGPRTRKATPKAEMVPAAAPPAPMAPDHGGAIDVFASAGNFEQAQRMAKALATSTLVPKEYQGNLPNVLIALELASRIGGSVFSVMQNIDIIHGRPSWRATFLIGTVNACGRFSPMRFRFEGKPGTDGYGCRAVAKDRETGEECVGALITIALAKAEGWSSKNGSKWKTMPEQMLMYRAAAFWTRVYSPELSLGMQTSDEVLDTHGAPSSAAGAGPSFGGELAGGAQDLEAALLGEAPKSDAEEYDPETGELVPPPADERQPGED